MTTGAGTLTLNGDVVLPVAGNSVPATISGNLNLGSGAAAAAHVQHQRPHLRQQRGLALRPDRLRQHQRRRRRRSHQDRERQGCCSPATTPTWAIPSSRRGILAVGSCTALGNGGTLSIGATLLAENGPQTLANPVSLDNNFTVGGADDLTFTGAANLTGGRTITVTNPIFFTLAGGLGESLGSQALTKSGPGFLVFTAPAVYSGGTTINTGGGAIILSGSGALLNTSGISVNLGGSLILDNTGGQQPSTACATRRASRSTAARWTSSAAPRPSRRRRSARSRSAATSTPRSFRKTARGRAPRRR